MKIAVYTICKNEAANVEPWFMSAKGADYFVLADTGSDDGTQTEAVVLPIKLARISVVPFRFDDARNAALALVPADADICVSLDLDERLTDGWRERIEKVCMGQDVRGVSIRYPYQFSPELTYFHNRVHGRDGWRWKYPDHEGLYRNMREPLQPRTIEGEPLIIQTQDKTKDRSKTLERLAWGEFEYPNDSRMVGYYARELMYAGYYKEAIEKFEKYFAMKPGFPTEQAEMARHLAWCYERS